MSWRADGVWKDIAGRVVSGMDFRVEQTWSACLPTVVSFQQGHVVRLAAGGPHQGRHGGEKTSDLRGAQ